MIVIFIIVIIIGICFGISASEELPEEIIIPKGRGPFYKAGYYLAKKLTNNQRNMTMIRQETEKYANVLLVLFLGSGVILLSECLQTGQEILETYIVRPAHGEADLTRAYAVEIESMTETELIEVQVAARAYSTEEKRQILQEASEHLEETILGENETVDDVRGAVVLPSQLAEGAVSVQWIQEPMGLLDEYGNITEDLEEEGEVLQLRALMTCEEEELQCEFALQLYPPGRSEEEKLLYSLKKEVENHNQQTLQQEKLSLPDQVNGRRVIWRLPITDQLPFFLFILIVAAIGAYVGKIQEFRQEALNRRRQLILDYPGILTKLAMLLNAGLTMQNAFVRIAEEYRGHRDKKPRYAYDEMMAACNEMRSGISEAAAYEHFGRRCGEAGYVKLGAMLAGGLQKGAEGLTRQLQEEAETAMEERRQLAKKLGEEAGTKLLMPMVLMLVVVIVILMVPAVLAF